eukprot:m.169987 g.169987  ORF g.169987 m.169987 type:complete len:522 (+) comp24184_c0_seq3:1192-2757(+)
MDKVVGGEILQPLGTLEAKPQHLLSLDAFAQIIRLPLPKVRMEVASRAQLGQHAELVHPKLCNNADSLQNVLMLHLDREFDLLDKLVAILVRHVVPKTPLARECARQRLHPLLRLFGVCRGFPVGRAVPRGALVGAIRASLQPALGVAHFDQIHNAKLPRSELFGHHQILRPHFEVQCRTRGEPVVLGLFKLVLGSSESPHDERKRDEEDKDEWYDDANDDPSLPSSIPPAVAVPSDVARAGQTRSGALIRAIGKIHRPPDGLARAAALKDAVIRVGWVGRVHVLDNTWITARRHARILVDPDVEWAQRCGIRKAHPHEETRGAVNTQRPARVVSPECAETWVQRQVRWHGEVGDGSFREQEFAKKHRDWHDRVVGPPRQRHNVAEVWAVVHKSGLYNNRRRRQWNDEFVFVDALHLNGPLGLVERCVGNLLQRLAKRVVCREGGAVGDHDLAPNVPGGSIENEPGGSGCVPGVTKYRFSRPPAHSTASGMVVSIPTYAAMPSASCVARSSATVMLNRPNG